MRGLFRRLLLWALTPTDEEDAQAQAEFEATFEAQCPDVPTEAPTAAPDPGTTAPIVGTTGLPHGVLAIPKARIDEREAEIAEAMADHKITPDVACIIALRRIHNNLVDHNKQTGYLLDLPTHGRPS